MAVNFIKHSAKVWRHEDTVDDRKLSWPDWLYMESDGYIQLKELNGALHTGWDFSIITIIDETDWGAVYTSFPNPVDLLLKLEELGYPPLFRNAGQVTLQQLWESGNAVITDGSGNTVVLDPSGTSFADNAGNGVTMVPSGRLIMRTDGGSAATISASLVSGGDKNFELPNMAGTFDVTP